MQRRKDNVQQHDSLRDTNTDDVADQKYSPPEHSKREERVVSIFRAQTSPESMQKYVEDMPRPQGAPRKLARIVSYSESAGIVRNTDPIGLKTFASSERYVLVTGNRNS